MSLFRGSFKLLLVLFVLILQASCDDSPSQSEDPPEEDQDVTEIINPIHAETDETLAETRHFNDTTDEELGTGRTEVTGEENTNLPVRSELNGYETTFTTVTFNTDNQVNDIEMVPVQTTPDSVDVTVRAIDDATDEDLDDLTVAVDDSVVATGVASHVITQPEGSEATVQVSRDGYQAGTQDVTFDADRTVPFRLEKSEPKKVTIRYDIRDEDGALIDEARLLADGEKIADGPQGEITTNATDSEVNFCGQADEYEESCQTKVPNQDHDISLQLTPKLVDVTVTAEDRDTGEGLDSLTVFVDDSVVATDVTTHIISRPLGTTVMVRVERAGYKPFRSELGFSRDRTVTATLIPQPDEPDMVEVTVNVSNAETGEPVNNPTIRVDDYTYRFGERSHSFPARNGERDVFVTATSFDTVKTSITADESRNLDIALTDIPACSDGIDNDGDGVADAEDGGCVDTWASTSHVPGTDGFVYEPGDDNERLRVGRTTHGVRYEDTQFISENQKEHEFIPAFVTKLRPLYQVAVTIEVTFTVLVTEGETAAFVLEWRTGPDDDNLNTVNTAETITVEGTGDWQEVTVPITRDYFENGTAYAVDAIHLDGAKIIFFAAERDDFVDISGVYESEEAQAQDKQQIRSGKLRTPNSTGIYRVTSTDTELK